MSIITRVYVLLYKIDTYNFIYNYTRDICIFMRVFVYTLISKNKLNYLYKCNKNCIRTCVITKYQFLF